LRALRVVYVGDLVVQPGETRARAAEQLELFTEIAVAAVREPPATAPHVGDIDLYLTQLRNLEVVEIGDLIEQRRSVSLAPRRRRPTSRMSSSTTHGARSWPCTSG
jgi:hypothetical protein